MFPGNIGFVGTIVILIVALLIFGKRLPDVARSLGKGIVEFKKGVRGIEDDVDQSVHSSQYHQPSQPAPPPQQQPPRDPGYQDPAGPGNVKTQD